MCPLKWIINQHVKYKAIKHLEENIGENFCDFWLGKDFFLDTTAKVQSIKEKN